MFIEEAAIPTAHVPVADHPALAHADSTQVLETVHEPAFVDPVRQRPVLCGNNFVVAFRSCKVLCSSLVLCQPKSRRLKWVTNLEFVAERLVVEENPRVIVLSIPLEFELAHALHQAGKL